MVLMLYGLALQIADFGLSRDLGEEESEYYVTSGRNIPVRITDPEVMVDYEYMHTLTQKTKHVCTL